MSNCYYLQPLTGIHYIIESSSPVLPKTHKIYINL